MIVLPAKLPTEYIDSARPDGIILIGFECWYSFHLNNLYFLENPALNIFLRLHYLSIRVKLL